MTSTTLTVRRKNHGIRGEAASRIRGSAASPLGLRPSWAPPLLGSAHLGLRPSGAPPLRGLPQEKFLDRLVALELWSRIKFRYFNGFASMKFQRPSLQRFFAENGHHLLS